jgi:hypothetical protein
VSIGYRQGSKRIDEVRLVPRFAARRPPADRARRTELAAPDALQSPGRGGEDRQRQHAEDRLDVRSARSSEVLAVAAVAGVAVTQPLGNLGAGVANLVTDVGDAVTHLAEHPPEPLGVEVERVAGFLADVDGV